MHVYMSMKGICHIACMHNATISTVYFLIVSDHPYKKLSQVLERMQKEDSKIVTDVGLALKEHVGYTVLLMLNRW